MSEQQGQGKALDNGRSAAKDLSPAEKLLGTEPLGPQIPGAQNPDSVEIKREINPNTE